MSGPLTDEELAFIGQLDEYFRALTEPRAYHVLDPARAQTAIDKARIALLDGWRAQAGQIATLTAHKVALTKAGETLARAGAAMGAAGDRLAHELIYSEHRQVMEEWWRARGGHEACTVCHPQEDPVPVAAAVPVCGCTQSNPWRCAIDRNLGGFVTCQCVCHRGSRTISMTGGLSGEA